MDEKITVRTAKDYKVSQWSGGSTTELYLYPEDGDYKTGNFQLRISSATVETERSEFTSLLGVERYLMIFQGHLDMIHGEEEKVSLEPYEVDHFDGGVPTVSYGKVVDFNLMLKNGGKGKMKSLCLKPGEEGKIMPEGKENFLALYVKEGKAELGEYFVEEEQILVMKNWEKGIVIKNSGTGETRMGICTAAL